MHVVRDGVSIFKRDRKLSAWADEDWTEDDVGGLRRKKYREFPTGKRLQKAPATSDVESAVPA